MVGCFIYCRDEQNVIIVSIITSSSINLEGYEAMIASTSSKMPSASWPTSSSIINLEGYEAMTASTSSTGSRDDGLIIYILPAWGGGGGGGAWELLITRKQHISSGADISEFMSDI